ncbi:MAG TPA: glycogen debranching enzyme N-terminal domain-containing protein [Waterburya sp.]|jgi:glycogen debranching enzyme
MDIEFGREICGTLQTAESREWLVTNGIGGYASGTVAGLLTRRYHGLLIAALNPPLGRTLLVTKLDETVHYNGQSYSLFTNRWTDGAVSSNGYHHIERFYLDGTTPVWQFGFSDVQLEKRIWMQLGSNTTCVQYFRGRQAPPKPEEQRVLPSKKERQIPRLLTMTWMGVGRKDEGVPNVW